MYRQSHRLLHRFSISHLRRLQATIIALSEVLIHAWNLGGGLSRARRDATPTENHAMAGLRAGATIWNGASQTKATSSADACISSHPILIQGANVVVPSGRLLPSRPPYNGSGVSIPPLPKHVCQNRQVCSHHWPMSLPRIPIA